MAYTQTKEKRNGAKRKIPQSSLAKLRPQGKVEYIQGISYHCRFLLTKSHRVTSTSQTEIHMQKLEVMRGAKTGSPPVVCVNELLVIDFTLEMNRA